MMFETTRAVRRTTTAMAIKKSLMDMGIPVYDEVCSSLQQYYKCTLSDCFDHPEFLKKVLQEMYGNASKEIIKSIHKNLGEDVNHISIECFLDSLSN